ncbi:hypothetical protein AKJ16_DCAP13416 [Drosera capensis]
MAMPKWHVAVALVPGSPNVSRHSSTLCGSSVNFSNSQGQTTLTIPEHSLVAPMRPRHTQAQYETTAIWSTLPILPTIQHHPFPRITPSWWQIP